METTINPEEVTCTAPLLCALEKFADQLQLSTMSESVSGRLRVADQNFCGGFGYESMNKTNRSNIVL